MSTKTMFLAIVTAVAAAPAVHAMPASVFHDAPGVVAGNGDVPRMSDAARDQILGSPTLHRAEKVRVFVQENGPSWVQWRAQTMR
jgi:hypothetical protein